MIGRTCLERGKPVVVVTRWGGAGPRNVLIHRQDGVLVVRPFRVCGELVLASCVATPH
jgi:hypothetical protein